MPFVMGRTYLRDRNSSADGEQLVLVAHAIQTPHISGLKSLKAKIVEAAPG
jgi:hypothetical protein